ncbi:MAG: M56 family metallopeptidase [Planctomycetota bacterium]
MSIDASGLGSLLGSWLATYLLHSTALIAAAWVITSSWRRLPEAVHEALWRTALLGGLLTASWPLVWTDASLESAPRPVAAASLSGSVTPTEVTRRRVAAANASSRGMVATPSLANAAPPPRQAVWSWLDLSLLGYGVLAAAGLLQLAWARARLRRRLADRRLIIEGGLPRRLLRLVDAAKSPRAVRLTTSECLTSPIAFGLLQPEICVPARALRELDVEQQESMVAHELAHLLHRDPQWLLLGECVQRLLFLQPLTAVARRRLLRLAELRCDAWAAARIGRPLSLARCLVDVAEWLLAAPRPLQHATSMAAERSQLGERIGRLLEDQPARRASAGRAPVLGTAALLGTAMLLPAVDLRERDDFVSQLPDMPLAAMPSSAGAPAPTRASIAALPLPAAMAALDAELAALDREITSAERALRGVEPSTELAALLERLKDHAERLRSRRGHARALMEEAAALLGNGWPQESGEER